MSLILAYHNEHFGVVCTDGRVSIRLPDGNQVASPGEVGRKSAALKPDLILAGSSSWSFELDYYIFGRMRELVQGNPALSFAEIASELPAVVASAYTRYPIPPETKINLILLGYDAHTQRVRNAAFAFIDGACEQSEYGSGAVASGFIEPEEQIGRKILDGMGGERTVGAAQAAMTVVAQNLAESRPNVIGPPYFFHVVERHEEGQVA